MIGEFQQIYKYMAPLAEKAEGAFALRNDGGVFHHGEDEEIVVTTDTLIAGVHFFADDPPFELAQKILGVNLSDLAAMGATPRYYTLNTSYPGNITEDWIAAFARGLQTMQDRYGITLLGGDTTRTHGPACFSLSAFGSITKGQALPRLGAEQGDLIFVSGTVGDGALGLLAKQGKLQDETGFLQQRYHIPQPRCALGVALCGLATACLDISDGLICDLGHFNIGADIHLSMLPLSEATRNAVTQDSLLWHSVLNGGDDYELLFCIKEDKVAELLERSQKTGTSVTQIGRITGTHKIRILDQNGHEYQETGSGYRHF